MSMFLRTSCCLFLLFFGRKCSACSPINRSDALRMPSLILVPTTTTPQAPMAADYYDDVDLHLTKINMEPPAPNKPMFSPMDSLKPSVSDVIQTTELPNTQVLLLKSPPATVSPVKHTIIAPPSNLVTHQTASFFRSRQAPIHILRDVSPIPFEKSHKIFPSLFDLFRPLVLPTLPPMKNSFLPKLHFQEVPRIISSVTAEPSFLMKVSPPVSWTFCDPICGSGDQAVDTDTALENAELDIREGVENALKQAHALVPAEDQITVQYYPNSTLLDDFGNYYGTDEFRYTAIGNSVAYRTHREDTNKNGQFVVEVHVKIRHSNNLSFQKWKQIGKQLQSYLKLYKGARFAQDIVLENEEIKPK